MAAETTVGGQRGEGHIVQDEGVKLRQRPYLNFTGTGVTCSDSGGKTVCNVTSGSGTPAGTTGQVQYNNGGSFGAIAEGTSNQVLTSNGATIAPSFKTLTGGGDALKADPLSQFAATTSAQLKGVLSDEYGATGNFFVANASTTTAGNILIADGSSWNSKAVSGAVTLSSTGLTTYSGTVPVSKGGTNTTSFNPSKILMTDGAGTTIVEATAGTDYLNSTSINTSLKLATILGDETGAGNFVLANGSTKTAGNILVADGTYWNTKAMTGDIAITSAGATAVQADSVALTTDTTGNYVSSATASQGLTVTGTEGASVGLQDCAASQVLRRDAGDTAWECVTLAGGGDALKSDPLSQFAATTSGQLAGVLSNETGTGAFVLSDSSTMTTPTITGATLNGVLDAGGATSLEVPNGANPTVDAAGKIGVDTSDDQFKYYGSALRILPYTHEFCRTLETPTDADDNIPFFTPVDNITITGVYGITQGGTSIAGTISDGTNTLEAITFDSDGQADDGSITNGTFTADERMEIDFSAPTGTVNWVTWCVRYTVDAQ